MTKSDVLAIFCADLHFSLTPPPLRSKEPDWFAAMQRPLDELQGLQEKYDCPIFCAGDVTDKWNASAELINWLLDHLPPMMYAIPGQHDLPEHDITQIERSAYWTLVKAGKIQNLPWDCRNTKARFQNFSDQKIQIWPFAYGQQITQGPEEEQDVIPVAIIHQYNWVDGCSYGSSAPEFQNLSANNNRPEFAGYDVVVSGDNHIPFLRSSSRDGSCFINCGALMRRKADDYFFPRVWLLRRGSGPHHFRVETYRLDISKDVYLERAKAEEMEKTQDADLSGLMKRLEELGTCALDFVVAMKLDLETNPTRKGVESRILRAME